MWVQPDLRGATVAGRWGGGRMGVRVRGLGRRSVPIVGSGSTRLTFIIPPNTHPHTHTQFQSDSENEDVPKVRAVLNAHDAWVGRLVDRCCLPA
jgi:hypothetical protein